MTLVDANVLLYAYDSSSPRHRAARTWWEERLSGSEPVGLAWATLVAFVRIGTHVRVFDRPMTTDEACGIVESWLERPNVSVVEPGARQWELFRRLVVDSQACGNLVTDAHLASLAIEHGLVLMSTDRDFARFSGLAWRDPLVP